MKHKEVQEVLAYVYGAVEMDVEALRDAIGEVLGDADPVTLLNIGRVLLGEDHGAVRTVADGLGAIGVLGRASKETYENEKHGC